MGDVIASDYLDPGVFARINFAVGPGSAAVGERTVVIVAPKLSGGSWAVNTKYDIEREQDAIDGAGSGSVLHVGVRKFLEGNRKTKLAVVPFAASSGAGVAAATYAVTISGTPSSGWADLFVGTEQLRYVFSASDTATTIADGLVALGNARTHLPVTLTNVAGAITVTAKTAGASQNGNILVRAATKPGSGMSWSAASGFVGDTVTGADGATTEAAGLAAALATLDADDSYYVVAGASDSTSIGHLTSYLTDAADPAVGLRKAGFVGFNGTIANAATLAIARNYERLHLVQQYRSAHTNMELAAAVAAVFAGIENADPSDGIIGYRGPLLALQAAPFQADWPDGNDRSDALQDGVLPIGSSSAGAFIVAHATTRSKDPTGTHDDRRALWSPKRSVSDAIVERLVQLWVTSFGGFKIQDDERLPNGEVNTAQRFPQKTVKPSQWRAEVVRELRSYQDDLAWLQNVERSLESLVVRISPSNSQRIETLFDANVVDHAMQNTLDVNEVSRS